MENLLSKSSGETLLYHSWAVQKIGVMLTERNSGIAKNEDIKAMVSQACLLHDIGKATDDFQNYLQTGDTSKKFERSPIYHHEVGWAVLKSIEKQIKIDTKRFNSLLSAIYWHHPRRERYNKGETVYNSDISDILKNITDKDYEQIIHLYNKLMGDNVKVENSRDEFYDTPPPPYYSSKTPHWGINANLSIVNSTLALADAIVSGYSGKSIELLNNKELCNRLIDKEILRTGNNEYTIPEYYDMDRFNKQVEYVNDSLSRTTSILKAPAGFGKTIMGILSILKQDRVTMWVCPRNVVAENVYDTIIEELNVLKVDMSVELYLTGERVKGTNANPDMTSDIIVTNIDNFLAPYYSGRNRNKAYLLYHANVIFDEFHELIKDEPLFSAFINIMNARNSVTKSNTLLLSATNTIVDYKWGSKISPSNILPNINNHYSAVHDEKYRIKYVDNIDFDIPDNTLVLFNAIKSAQNYYVDNIKRSEGLLLYHSKYEEVDKDKVKNEIFGMYGKNATNKKINVISTPIMKASLDLSFDNLVISNCEPEGFIQSIGRVNRWGKYKGVSEIYLYKPQRGDGRLTSENGAIGVNYTLELTNKWYEFLQKNTPNGSLFTLDELYVIYNKFNLEYNDDLRWLIDNKYEESNNKLGDIYPKRSGYETKKEKSKHFRIGTQSMRGGAGNLFAIYPYVGDDDRIIKYSNAFTIDDRGEKEPTGFVEFTKKLIKEINKSKEDRFDFPTNGNAIKHLRSTTLYSMANYSGTPLIKDSKVYDHTLGVVDRVIYNSLIK